MKTVGVITGSRAEYGQLKPLLKRLLESEIRLNLIVTGSHLLDSGGNTIKEIEDDEIPIYAKIRIPDGSKNRVAMSNATGEAIKLYTAFFEKGTIDILVLIGDRYEMFAAATAAALLEIPCAHICGGSVTAGAVDEFFRHSITKMSLLHFTTCSTYRNRVIQLGEEPSRVFNVGSLAIENVLQVPLMSVEKFGESIKFKLDRPYCVVTFHPETLSARSPESQLQELIDAMIENNDLLYIITLANVDAGGSSINERWISEGEKHDNWYVTPSLGLVRYLSALKYAEMMIGNSSSGTTEGPAMHIPVVNIGNRQKGRIMADCVIQCNIHKTEICAAINKARSKEMKDILRNTISPFGDGHTSEKIVDIIRTFLYENLHNLQKEFYDIKVE